MTTVRRRALSLLEDTEVCLAGAIQADQTDSQITDVAGLVEAYKHVDRAIKALRQISLGEVDNKDAWKITLPTPGTS